MKLYSYPLAPNPRRVRMFMAEKAITDIELIDVDIMQGAHRFPAFIARTNVAALPVLELDDGLMIGESLAICRYLESLYPEANMFGRTPREMAEIEMWTRRCELLLANPLMLATRLSHPAMTVLEPNNPEVAKYFIEGAQKFSGELDVRLKDREFIVGDRLTMADIASICAFDFARIIRVRPDQALESLGAYIKRMRSRASAGA